MQDKYQGPLQQGMSICLHCHEVRWPSPGSALFPIIAKRAHSDHFQRAPPWKIFWDRIGIRAGIRVAKEGVSSSKVYVYGEYTSAE